MLNDCAMDSRPRLRFAPSPTGYLHIGGVRTALFNWLWARKTGGVFVLRIEDTDQARSEPANVSAIVDSLGWLGLDWDEGPEIGGPCGPYFQMQRLPLYQEYAEKLIRAGRAYRCYCTKEDLADAREKLKRENPKASFQYPGTCRRRTDHPDLPCVVRFNMEAVTREATTYRDLVFGEVTTSNSTQQDFVLLRSDGVPLYNFGAVIDDLTMGITLVVRGRDHMVNTPIQLLLYEALGHAPPEFAHLPMILAPTGEKLSKRHGAVSVDEYRKVKGYTPMAVLNYLVRFGWSHGDQEVFTREELIEKFGFDHVGKPDGKFDAKKFADIAFEHLKQERLMDIESYARQVVPFLEQRGLVNVDGAKLRAAIGTIRERARTLVDAAEALDYFLRDKPVFDEVARSKYLIPENVEGLRVLVEALQGVSSFDRGSIEAAIHGLLSARGIPMKVVAQPARVALTGRSASPGLFDVLAVLGSETSLSRLREAIELARAGSS